MLAYGYISKVIAPRLVLELEPELLTFTATEMAPNMAEAMESMPNMETLIKLANHITITTVVISVVVAYLLACVVALFVEFKQSNKSLKAVDALKRAP